MPPNDHLRQHNWRGDEQNGNDIDQDEGAAAATAERVRKLPNVSKTDGGSNGGLDEEVSVNPSCATVLNVRGVCHILNSNKY